MKLVDVTLRDGGFVNDFNWDMSLAKKHIDTMEKIGIHMIELGYWKQTEKSKNPFYNFNEDHLNFLTSDTNKSTVFGAMIDYHYCQKSMDEYPSIGESRLELIRVTSRKEDFRNALEFSQKLKDEKKLKVSFQVINSTNYSKKELEDLIKLICEFNLDIVAFADSHGNLNLNSDLDRYMPAIDILKSNNMQWGLHLHNHTGRANMNYWIGKSLNCNYMDASVKGLGKGGGNLKLEEIVDNEVIPEIMNFMVNHSPEEMSIHKAQAYNTICGRWNVTDNYRKVGMKHNLDFSSFQSIIKKIEGIDKDTYNPETFEFWLEKYGLA